MKAFTPQRPGVAALPGFEDIARIWDEHHKIWLAKIHPGDTCVTASTEGVTTVRSRTAPADAGERSGVDAMERLLNAVLAHGSGERSRLELKLVGGSCVRPDAQQNARRAVDFARRFAATARLTIAAEDVGGVLGRDVIYWPGTGQLQVRKLRGVQALMAQREQEYGRSLAE